LCQDKTGTQGQQVTNLSQTKEIGVTFAGCGAENGGDDPAGDVDAYMDTVTYIGASSSTDITVTVLGVTLGVTIEGAVSFTGVAQGSLTVADSALTVTNSGTVNERYSLSLVNPSAWTAVSTTPGYDTYVLDAIFNTYRPGVSEFGSEDYVLELPRRCDGSVFAGNDPGLTVPPSAAKYLWLLLKAPGYTLVTTPQTIRLIVSAEVA